jgi:hypothetical protein
MSYVLWSGLFPKNVRNPGNSHQFADYRRTFLRVGDLVVGQTGIEPVYRLEALSHRVSVSCR